MRRNSPSLGSKLLTILLTAGLIGGTAYYYWNIENKAVEVQNGTAENMYFKDTIVDERTLEDTNGSGNESAIQPTETAGKNLFAKLSDGETVNIAVLGDTFGYSVGATEGSEWANVLASKIQDTYNSEVNIVQHSVPSSYAYQGYCIAMENDWSDIDLAILCYGAADQTDIDIAYFERNFEAAIRGLMTKNPNITVMPMISTYVSDSNFSGAIREAADHYGLTCLNMNNAFIDSGYTEDELTSDGIYPNDQGYEAYADGIVKQITELVDAGATNLQSVDVAGVKTLFSNVKKMDEYTFVGADSMTKESDATYSITGKTGRVVGIAYKASQSEYDSISVSVDGEYVATVDCSSSYEGDMTRYFAVTSGVSKDSVIRVTPNCSGGAEFVGIVLSK